jgi:hypothetical protein
MQFWLEIILREFFLQFELLKAFPSFLLNNYFSRSQVEDWETFMDFPIPSQSNVNFSILGKKLEPT